MGAPGLDTPEFQGAVDKAIDARFARSNIDLDHIPKNDDVSRFMEAWDELKGGLADTIDDKIARTHEEKFKAALEKAGLSPETVEYMRGLEEQIKKLDKRGTPQGQREAFQPDGAFRREAYTNIGRAAVASVFQARHEPLPKEYTENGVQRAQLGGTDTAGGVTIPDLRLDDWMILAKDHSTALKVFETVELGDSLTLIVPTLSTDVAVSKLTTEGTTEASETEAVLLSEANSSVEAQVVGAFVSMSRKIPPARLMAMENQIGRLLMREHGNLQDAYIFNHASSPFTDMMTAASNTYTMPATKTLFTQILHNDLTGLQFKIDPNSIGNGVFLWHPSLFGTIVGLMDTTNRPIYHTGWVTPQGMLPGAPVSDAAPGLLLNRPAWFSTSMPDITASAADTAFGLYFDPQFGLIGNSQSPFTETDESQDRKKFMRHIYIFSAFAFKYFQGAGAAVIKTSDS